MMITQRLFIGCITGVFLLTGCAELRGSRPATVARPKPSVTTPGQVEKVTSQTGVVREVVHPPGPQLAAARTPQRLASMEIVEKGKVMLKQHNYDKALQAFQEAVAVDGTNGVAYYYLAQTRYELKQFSEAMGLLDRAESLLGDAPDWLANVTGLKELVRAAIR